VILEIVSWDSPVPIGDQVVLDVAQRHTAGIQADDHLIQAAESARPLGTSC
jgi:hypothetical protein